MKKVQYDVQAVQYIFTVGGENVTGEREKTTIRLPVELKERLQQEADRKQITLLLDMNLYKELKIISEQTGLTISSLLIVAIWQNVLKLKYLMQ